MKKFINFPETLLAESLDGFAAAHADIVILGPEFRSKWLDARLQLVRSIPR